MVRFYVYYRIKPHVSLLGTSPAYFFEFHPCESTSPVENLCVNNIQEKTRMNSHRLLPGLLGCLIPFETRAFVPQRQYNI